MVGVSTSSSTPVSSRESAGAVDPPPPIPTILHSVWSHLAPRAAHQIARLGFLKQQPVSPDASVKDVQQMSQWSLSEQIKMTHCSFTLLWELGSTIEWFVIASQSKQIDGDQALSWLNTWFTEYSVFVYYHQSARNGWETEKSFGLNSKFCPSRIGRSWQSQIGQTDQPKFLSHFFFKTPCQSDRFYTW